MKERLALFILLLIILTGGQAYGACTGTVFIDVTAGAVGDAFCDYIERFFSLGITSGCQPDNPSTPQNEAMYCPSSYVTRGQMAVFVTRALDKVPDTLDDKILSQHIKEADGTSGQNTNTGNGVKTAHIQNSAVTTAKIANGAVTDAKITGLISAAKISSTGLNADTLDGIDSTGFAPVSHTHDGSDIVSGKVSTARLNVGTSAGTVAAGNHNHDGIYQKKYGRVAVVALSGGDYTSPVAAMDDLSSWCPSRSAANPCLLKIMPGIYDIAASSLAMEGYVDIEGSGENTTKITGTVSGVSVGVVYGATFAGLRFLTVEHRAGYNTAAIYNSGGSPDISHVTVLASGGTNTNVGIFNWNSSPDLDSVTIRVTGTNVTNSGIYNYQGSPTLRNFQIGVSGSGATNRGIYNLGSSPSISRAKVLAAGGAQNYAIYNSGTGTTVTIDQSDIRGFTNSIYNGSGVTTYVGGSKLSIGPVSNAGVIICAGVYDENYIFYTSTCP